MFTAYTEFQKLKTVMIGRTYDSSAVDLFDDKIMSESSKRLLKQLLDETEEDYQNLVKVCEDFGTKVIRPEYSQINDQPGYAALSAHPSLMNPRDHLFALEEKLIVGFFCDNHIAADFCRPLAKYKSQFVKNNTLHGFCPPSCIRLGDTIILDRQSHMTSNTTEVYDYFKNWLEPLGYKIIYTPYHNFKFADGRSHADSCLAVLKPGVLLTINESKSYTEEIFEGWDGHTVQEKPRQIQGWQKARAKYSDWFFEDKDYHDEIFNHMINDWFVNWVGKASETVFDVNVLSLDENHVVVSNYNKGVFDYLKKHKIEPIISPWRHRFFWDGGIHCITLDLEREGGRESYL